MLLPKIYAGVDEAGRGPLAGPVFAAVVILDPAYTINGLKDSKLLSPKKREMLAAQIKTHALDFGLGRAEVEEIDRLNIFHASLLAMKRAVEQLRLSPPLVIIDGTHCPDINLPAKAVIKADKFIPAVSAASILAKTARDAVMVAYDQQYPTYQLAIHKGYGTQKHRDLIKKYGLSPIHRRSFKISI